MTFPYQLVQFIIGLAALIILHELGHFLVARLFKVEVEEFGLGFPPRAAKLFEAGGTQFTLNWIPLGGFVRPKGENDPSIPGGLAAANPWVRLAVLAAGPAMNLLIGLVLGIFLFYSLGDPIQDRIKVLRVAPESPAAQAGIRPEDIILSVNGQSIESMEEIHDLISQNLDRPTEIVYQRGSQTFTVSLVPRSEPPPEEGAIGIVMGHPTRPIGLSQAAYRGGAVAFENVRGILLLPVRLLQGDASPEETRLVGYKGLYDIYQQINPLWFFMAISISLGVINLFPIPALDGGRILLTLPEIFLRRRIPPHYENMIHLVGFTLLLILIIYVNMQDFLNPIQLPR